MGSKSNDDGMKKEKNAAKNIQQANQSFGKCLMKIQDVCIEQGKEKKRNQDAKY